MPLLEKWLSEHAASKLPGYDDPFGNMFFDIPAQTFMEQSLIWDLANVFTRAAKASKWSPLTEAAIDAKAKEFAEWRKLNQAKFDAVGLSIQDLMTALDSMAPQVYADWEAYKERVAAEKDARKKADALAVAGTLGGDTGVGTAQASATSDTEASRRKRIIDAIARSRLTEAGRLSQQEKQS